MLKILFVFITIYWNSLLHISIAISRSGSYFFVVGRTVVMSVNTAQTAIMFCHSFTIRWHSLLCISLTIQLNTLLELTWQEIAEKPSTQHLLNEARTYYHYKTCFTIVFEMIGRIFVLRLNSAKTWEHSFFENLMTETEIILNTTSKYSNGQ